MNEIGLVFPVLPGKRDALLSFAAAIMGPRRAEYEASQVSVNKESWFLQPTTMGDLIIIHFEAPDVMSVFAGMATSREPFDVWFREQVLDITGVDLAVPPPGLPERVFHWSRGN